MTARPFLPIKSILVEFYTKPYSKKDPFTVSPSLQILGAVLTYYVAGMAILISCLFVELTGPLPLLNRFSSPRPFSRSVRPMRSPPRTALQPLRQGRRLVFSIPPAMSEKEKEKKRLFDDDTYQT